jgi:hypothetical protein
MVFINHLILFSIPDMIFMKTKTSLRLSKNVLTDLVSWVDTVTRIVFFLALGFYLGLCLCQYHWNVHIGLLLQRYRWNDEQKDLSRTYYERHCSYLDISTDDPMDLLIQSDWGPEIAQEKILTHGVSIFPNLIDREVAADFRNFTLSRNFKLRKDELVYVMNSFNKKKQTRWAFAFTAQDHPSVPKLLREVGSNLKLRKTLELFLGPDPAVIKMQTITAGFNAESQGWHPDVNAKASVLSHARDFMMHFSLLIPLQDTYPRMGATGICPGTQYCSSLDDKVFHQGCHQVITGRDIDGRPVWGTGDAVLMNQNTWHCGGAHSLRDGDDRAIVVITFTSRPRSSGGKIKDLPTHTPLPLLVINKRATTNHSIFQTPDTIGSKVEYEEEVSPSRPQTETRVLSLGTPLTSFGYTMRDMVDPVNSKSNFLGTLRLFGLYKPSKSNWGWDYLSSVYSRIASETHKFKREDLSEWLANLKSGSFGGRLVLKYLLFDKVPSSNKNRGVWDQWWRACLIKSLRFFRNLVVGMALLLIVVALITAESLVEPRKRANIFVLLQKRLFLPLVLLLSVLGGLHWKISSSSLIREIKSGSKLRSSFPILMEQIPDGSSFQSRISLIPLAGYRRIIHGRPVTYVKPTRDDVLIGTRLNSLYLGAVNQFLQYHTGNRRWLSHIRDFVKSATSNEEYRYEQLSRSPASVLLDQLAAQVTGIVKGKYLLQNPESGHFIELTDQEAQRATRRQLMTEFSPILAMLDESLSFIISELSFESPLRTTLLTSVSVGVLEQIREAMFGEFDNRLGSDSSAHCDSGSIIQTTKPRALMTLFQLGGLSLYHDKLNISRTVPRHPAIVSKRQETHPTHLEGRQSSPHTNMKKRRKVDGKRIVHYLNKSKQRK